MIGSRNRFHGRGGIRKLYATGKTVRSGAISLRYSPEDTKAYRVAVVVSKKVNRSAVVRNRIRRRIYERVRILYSSGLAPRDIIITVFDDQVATMSPQELDYELAGLLKKAKLTSVSPTPRAIVEAQRKT